MASKNQQHFLGTYSKVILSTNWTVLAKLIVEHTTLVKDQKATTNQDEGSNNFNILTDRQLDDILAGPYQHTIKQQLSAYAAVAKVKLAFNLNSEEFSKGRAVPEDDEQGIPAEILAATSIADLNALQENLEQLTEQQFSTWGSHIQGWKNEIINTLNTAEIQLSDIEIKEFQDEEPMSELSERFDSLNVATLPVSEKQTINFEKYFLLKSYIAIHSCLSRQHLANSDVEIKKVLKSIKALLSRINKQETELLNIQQDEINNTIKAILH